MLNRVLGDYGAPYSDKKAVEDPTCEMASSLFNTMTEDVAQMTRTIPKIVLQFPTISTLANTTPSYTETIWGSGVPCYPTSVTRTGTGAYTITYPASQTDGLGNVESVSFSGARGTVQSTSVVGHVQCTAAANVISVQVFDMAGAAVDVTNGTTIRIEAR